MEQQRLALAVARVLHLAEEERVVAAPVRPHNPSDEVRERTVDDLVARGLAAGGAEPVDPQDLGFMYSRDLEDPDGNTLEFFWMDPAAAEQGPEARAASDAYPLPQCSKRRWNPISRIASCEAISTARIWRMSTPTRRPRSPRPGSALRLPRMRPSLSSIRIWSTAGAGQEPRSCPSLPSPTSREVRAFNRLFYARAERVDEAHRRGLRVAAHTQHSAHRRIDDVVVNLPGQAEVQ